MSESHLLDLIQRLKAQERADRAAWEAVVRLAKDSGIPLGKIAGRSDMSYDALRMHLKRHA